MTTNEELRSQIANDIREAFSSRASICGNNISNIKAWVEHDDVGPLGGVKSQVTLALEIDSEIFAVSVNVYCDDKITDKLKRRLEEESAKKAEKETLRSQLGWIIRPPAGNYEPLKQPKSWLEVRSVGNDEESF